MTSNHNNLNSYKFSNSFWLHNQMSDWQILLFLLASLSNRVNASTKFITSSLLYEKLVFAYNFNVRLIDDCLDYSQALASDCVPVIYLGSVLFIRYSSNVIFLIFPDNHDLFGNNNLMLESYLPLFSVLGYPSIGWAPLTWIVL